VIRGRTGDLSLAVSPRPQQQQLERRPGEGLTLWTRPFGPFWVRWSTCPEPGHLLNLNLRVWLRRVESREPFGPRETGPYPEKH